LQLSSLRDRDAQTYRNPRNVWHHCLQKQHNFVQRNNKTVSAALPRPASEPATPSLGFFLKEPHQQLVYLANIVL
jgi:hypothetical protein